MICRKTVLALMLVVVLTAIACSNDEETPVTSAPTETNGVQFQEIEYDIGDKWEFAYYDSGTKYGSNTYEVVRKGTPEGKTVYIFESHLKYELTSACKPTTFDTTYHVSSTGIPQSYNMSGKIGKG